LHEIRAFDAIAQMHCLITYGTSGGTPPQIEAIHKSFSDVLRVYPHYRALGNTYIVRLSSISDWQTIFKKLGPVASAAPIPLNFIMTPMMQPGNPYNGLMPKPAWEEINKLTQW
jgi:hypothetical protein